MRRLLRGGVLGVLLGTAPFAAAQEADFLPREAFGQVVFGRVQSGGDSTIRLRPPLGH